MAKNTKSSKNENAVIAARKLVFFIYYVYSVVCSVYKEVSQQLLTSRRVIMAFQSKPCLGLVINTFFIQ